MLNLKLKRVSEHAVLPKCGSEKSAGYDLYAATNTELHIPPHKTVLVPTGWQMEFPEGYFGAIFARSGIATKQGLRPANCVGVCDEDYRGEVKVALHNDTDEPQTIAPQERVAQLVLLPYQTISISEVDELSDTSRGEGGFGSTGKL